MSTPPVSAAAAPTPASHLPRAGFVGTGMMGVRMAQNLLRGGVPLVVYNRTRAKAEPLVASGAEWAERPSAVARAVPGGVIFLMLTDGRAVERTLFGRGGLAGAATAGTLIVDHSTIDPEESRALSTRLAERGIGFVDAPVGGSIGPAERAEVKFFVGGSDDAVARALPYLERMGRGVERLGPVGAGAAMKLVNNLMTIGTVALLAETLAAGEALGLERRRMVELLRRGGGASVMLENKHRNLAERVYRPEFLLGLARKDLSLLERAARRGGRSTPLAREARRLLEEALRQGHDREDFSSVAETARLRGLKARPNAPAVPVAAPASPSPPSTPSSEAPASPPADGSDAP